MKLRLNKALRAAVLSCGTAALSCGVAQAAYEWNGGAITDVTDTSNESTWNDHDNWKLTDSTTWTNVPADKGPGKSGSGAWDPIVINNGASGTVADLEGWCLNLSVQAGDLTVDNLRKLQGGAEFNVGDSASLTIDFKKHDAGNDGGKVNINLTGSGALTMNLYNDKGGETTTVNYGVVTGESTVVNDSQVSGEGTLGRGTFTLTGQGGRRTYNSLVFVADIGSAVSNTIEVHRLTLANIIGDVTITSTPTYKISGAFLESSARGTFENVQAADIGCYSIVENSGTYTLYYVTGSKDLAGQGLSLTEGETETLSSTYGDALSRLRVTVTPTTGNLTDAAILTVNRNFSLGALTVKGGALCVDINAGNTLKLGETDSEVGASIALKGGGTLCMVGSGELGISNLSQFTGTLQVEDYNSVTLNADAKNLSLLTMGNNSTLTVEAEHTLTTAAVSDITGNVEIIGNFTATSTNNTAGIHQTGGGTVTFSGNGVGRLGRLEMGDIQSSETSKLSIGSGYTLVITGSINSADDPGYDTNRSIYKNASLLIGEWGSQTTVEVSGNLLAKNACLMTGDVGGSVTINDGGVVAVKGIKRAKSNNTNMNLTLNIGGTLIIGETGINFEGNGTKSFTLAGGTLGISADSVTITNALAITGNVAFDTAKYTFADNGSSIAKAADAAGGTLTISGELTGSGTLAKTGEGTLKLSHKNISYSGAIDVQGGFLEVAANEALGTGTLTVGANGTLIVDQNITTSLRSTSIAGTLKLENGSRLNLTKAAEETTSLLSITNLVLNGNATIGMSCDQNLLTSFSVTSLTSNNSTLTLDFSNPLVPFTQDPNQVVASGLSNLSGGNLILTLGGQEVEKVAGSDNTWNKMIGRTDYTWTLDTNGSLTFSVGKSAPMNLVWAGNSGDTWAQGGENWQNQGVTTPFQNNDSVTFESGESSLIVADTIAVNNMSLEDGAQVTLGVAGTSSSLTAATLALGSATMTTNGLSTTVGNLIVETGKTATLSLGTDATLAAETLTLGSGETGTGTTQLIVNGTGTTVRNLIVETGKTATLSLGTDATLEVTGMLSTAESSRLTLNGGIQVNTITAAANSTLTINGAVTGADNAASLSIAEGGKLVLGEGGSWNGKYVGSSGSTVVISKAGNTQIEGNTAWAKFQGTLDVAKGSVYVGAAASSSGGADATLGASKVVVRSGASFITHFNTNTSTDPKKFSAAIYTESGATIGNKDGHAKWTGDIHLNMAGGSTPGTTVQYNSTGETEFNLHWDKEVTWSGSIYGSGTLNITTSTQANPRYLILSKNQGQEGAFNGTYRLKGNTSNWTGLRLDADNAAKDAKIDLHEGQVRLVVNTANAVIAGLSGDAGEVYATGGNRTLTIQQSDNSTFAGVIKDSGDNKLSVTKGGDCDLVLSGTNTYSGATTVTGGTLKVTGRISDTSSAAVSRDGVLEISGENASVTVGGTMTARANSGQDGTARNVTITTTNSEQDGTVTKNVTIAASGSSGATSGEGDALQALGEMTGLTLAFAAENTAAEISNVTLQDVTLNATGGTVTVTYTNAKAVAATAGAAVAPVLYAATATEMPETLTAMDVQVGGTAKGTLTIDVTHELLRANAGKDFKWTIFDGVSLAADGSFTLVLGDILKTIVDNGKPTVTLSGDWVSNNEHSLDLTSGDLVKLHTGTGGLLAGSVAGGNLVLTIKNVPEPTTGTLSVLALAALAARRRRK